VAGAILLAAALSGGCSTALATKRPSRSDAIREFSAPVHVHEEVLTLHLAAPQTPPSASTPLVLYASGDGGWFGAAVGMFRTIVSSGLPTVGFSTKAFMRLEHRWSNPPTEGHVVEGYQQIIDGARARLRLPKDAPVVLTGWSRGASLGVLVGSSRDADPRVIGLVAVGLAAYERLDIEADSDDEPGSAAEAPAGVSDELEARSIAMYPLLSRMAPRRSVVIQASGDKYLGAARARELFGSDSPVKRLVAIGARNHRFGGGEARFAEALVEAVKWIGSSAEETR
jgi:hypothetical protein